MDYVDELTSGRTPLVKKAAKKILKGKLKGNGPFLHQALEGEMEKPRSWETQMYLLYASAVDFSLGSRDNAKNFACRFFYESA